MAILSAFTKNTAKNMQLDAGLLVKGLTDILNFNGTIADEKKLGATSGGASFSATPEMRNIFEGIDGAKGNYKDGNVIDNWEITLTATVNTASRTKFTNLNNEYFRFNTVLNFDFVYKNCWRFKYA